MPPPAFGKGNAFRTVINDKYVELARKDAQRIAGLSAALDSERERQVLGVITSSSLDSERRQTACKEVRKALGLARRGVDPSNEKSITHCAVCKGTGRTHVFLCLTRQRNPSEPEKTVAHRAWREINEYLHECRAEILQQVCLLSAPYARAPTLHTRARLRPTDARLRPMESTRAIWLPRGSPILSPLAPLASRLRR